MGRDGRPGITGTAGLEGSVVSGNVCVGFEEPESINFLLQVRQINTASKVVQLVRK